jgi:hypothetical protein
VSRSCALSVLPASPKGEWTDLWLPYAALRNCRRTFARRRYPLANEGHRAQGLAVRVVGWNDIPAGYGASFDVARAPLWLQALFATPFVDRFAYPLLVRRGLGVLRPSREWPADRLGPVGDGWRVES